MANGAARDSRSFDGRERDFNGRRRRTSGNEALD